MKNLKKENINRFTLPEKKIKKAIEGASEAFSLLKSIPGVKIVKIQV